MCGNAVLNLITSPLSPQINLIKKSESNVLRYEAWLFIYTNVIT